MPQPVQNMRQRTDEPGVPLREREALHVARDAEEPVAEDLRGERADEHAEDDEPDARQPRLGEERARERLEVLRGDPRRDLLGDAGRDRGVGADEELRPDRHRVDADAHERAREEEQHVDLRARHLRVGALGDLDEEQHGHPLGGAADAGAGHQLHVDGAGHHDERDEDRAHERREVEAVREVLRHFEDRAELLELGVLRLDAAAEDRLEFFEHGGRCGLMG